MPPDQTSSTDPADSTSSGEAGLLNDAHALWLELRGLGHDRLQLAALESQRAGLSLVDMLVAGILIAVLLNTAWLGLVAAAVLGMLENGIAASSVILLAVAGNLLLVLMLAAVIRHKSRYLAFPALLRSLTPAPTPQDTGRPR
ncbi:MAG: hypothetical protein CTY19_09775 [Methylomonas sp.]|nr:MAG: hypothetical protein CTY19_09775 [Methylomonas sp.]